MPRAQTGAGDPARSMALLWAADPPAGGRGRPPSLTVRAVTRAAVELADLDGLEALSMRRVAERLGVGTMSLYTYVPGRAELIDLMYDAIHLELSDELPTGTWRERLAAVAADQWRLAKRHPWMLRVGAARPPMGPGIIAKYERELGVVDGLGLDDVEMDAVVTLVNDFVAGMAGGALDATEARRVSGVDDVTWWATTGPRFAEVFDPARYPLAARVGAAAGAVHQGPGDPDHAFEFGMARVLDGIAVLVESGR